MGANLLSSSLRYFDTNHRVHLSILLLLIVSHYFYFYFAVATRMLPFWMWADGVVGSGNPTKQSVTEKTVLPFLEITPYHH
jgi:hypothetical protein